MMRQAFYETQSQVAVTPWTGGQYQTQAIALNYETGFYQAFDNLVNLIIEGIGWADKLVAKLYH